MGYNLWKSFKKIYILIFHLKIQQKFLTWYCANEFYDTNWTNKYGEWKSKAWRREPWQTRTQWIEKWKVYKNHVYGHFLKKSLKFEYV